MDVDGFFPFDFLAHGKRFRYLGARFNEHHIDVVRGFYVRNLLYGVFLLVLKRGFLAFRWHVKDLLYIRTFYGSPVG